MLHIDCICTLLPVGGAGGLPDTHLEDGAAAAAATGGAVGGVGERHSTHPARQAHQHSAGCHGCPAGVRVDGGKLCGPAYENTQPHAFHAAPRHPPGLPLEELGGHFTVPGPFLTALEMTCTERDFGFMKGKKGRGLSKGPETNALPQPL